MDDYLVRTLDQAGAGPAQAAQPAQRRPPAGGAVQGRWRSSGSSCWPTTSRRIQNIDQPARAVPRRDAARLRAPAGAARGDAGRHGAARACASSRRRSASAGSGRLMDSEGVRRAFEREVIGDTPAPARGRDRAHHRLDRRAEPQGLAGRERLHRPAPDRPPPRGHGGRRRHELHLQPAGAARLHRPGGPGGDRRATTARPRRGPSPTTCRGPSPRRRWPRPARSASARWWSPCSPAPSPT